jgi:hypothetical protein
MLYLCSTRKDIAMLVLKARVLFSLWLPQSVRLSADEAGSHLVLSSMVTSLFKENE